MKRCLVSIIAFLLIVAFSSACEIFAQETYDFEGTIQVKVGKKKIKEDVNGTVDVTMTEEGGFIKKKNSKSSHDDTGGGTFESATFGFEFSAEMIQNAAIPWMRNLLR